MRFFLLILIFSTSACSTLKQTELGTMVKAGKNDPPSNCQELDVVEWDNVGGFTKYSAKEIRNYLKNKTGELGGNYLRLDGVGRGAGNGTAFKCP